MAEQQDMRLCIPTGRGPENQVVAELFLPVGGQFQRRIGKRIGDQTADAVDAFLVARMA